MWCVADKKQKTYIDYDTGEVSDDIGRIDCVSGVLWSNPIVYGLCNMAITNYNVAYSKRDYKFMREYVEGVRLVQFCDWGKFIGGSYHMNGVCNEGVTSCSLLSWLAVQDRVLQEFYISTYFGGYAHFKLKDGFGMFLVKEKMLSGVK